MSLFIIYIILITKILAHEILIDKIFNQNFELQKIDFTYCPKNNKEYFYFRGRINNIKDILDSNKAKNLNKYNFIYLPDLESFKYVKFFPKSTIFMANSQIKTNITSFDKEYCYLTKFFNFKKYDSLYYISIGKEVDKNLFNIILVIYFVLSLVTMIFSIVVNIRLCFFSFYQQIFLYDFSRTILSFSIILAFSCLILEEFLIIHLLYSIQKSFIFISLLLLVNGFTILNYDFTGFLLLKYLLFFLIFESFSTIIFIYIIYFFPTLNNFYLFFIRDLAVHIILLIITIKAFIKKFIPLFRQYKFERNMRSFLLLVYKIKLIFYLKVFIFSFLYSIAFIIFPFIILIYHFQLYAKSFYFIYYFKIAVEIFFSNFCVIIFFPHKVSILYFLPIFYDYNSRRFLCEVGKDNKYLKASNLNKNILNKYKKENIPIVLINPFSKNNDNELFGNIHIGIV